MGFVMSKVWSLFASQGEVKVILIGLDNAGACVSWECRVGLNSHTAGKTTTLYKL